VQTLPMVLKLVFGKVNLNSCCVPIFQSLATVAEIRGVPNLLDAPLAHTVEGNLTVLTQAGSF